MRKFKRILVALKELDIGLKSPARKALQLAHASGAELELFHCLSNPLVAQPASDYAWSLEQLQREERERALERLERLAAKLRAAAPAVRVTVSAQWDVPVYEGIVRRAQKIHADLIVASRHHGTHVLPGLMRLTDWELVRLSPVPVLLVRSPRLYRRPAILVAVDPSHAFAKPLQLDGRLLGIGAELCRDLRGSLHAVHAYMRVPGGAIPASGMANPAHALRQVEAEARQAAQLRFERVLKGAPIGTAHRYLIPQHPVDAILQAARKSHSAMVVMGAISRSGFKRLLIGNTAEQMLDELTCDVLVVKPVSFSSRVPRRVGRLNVWPQPATPWGVTF